MKKISFIALFLCFAISATWAQRLKVMSYNLRFGELASMAEFAQFIQAEDPDIVFLQEVDWKTKRSRAPKQNGVAMINALAAGTDMFALYGRSIDYAEGYYGIGILSKYPFVKSERLALPNPEPQKEQRSLLEGEIILKDGKQLLLMATHLEVSTPEHRKAQLAFINQRAKKAKYPVILGGDFNAAPTSKEIVEGTAQWDNMTNDEFTFSTSRPSIKIDYIYCRPKTAFRLIETSVPKVKLSDHFPVISIIEMK